MCACRAPFGRSGAFTEPLERLTAALADRYTIQRELGAGGMATVYLAEDLRHHRKVALKVLKPELGAAIGPDRFLREIEIAASLAHPHILPLHDSGEAVGFLYYVMPFVEGESRLSCAGHFDQRCPPFSPPSPAPPNAPLTHGTYC